MADKVTKAVEAATSAMAAASVSASNDSKMRKDEETGEMVSKSEYKRRQKARSVAAKKAEKQAATPKNADQKKADEALGDLEPSQARTM
jgi:lysyl-tRNA synthetase, class II